MASLVPETDVPKYENMLQDAKSRVTALRAWKDKLDASPEGQAPEALDQTFDEELKQALGYCKAVFGIFRDDRQFERLADELADTIVETRNYLGPALMPLDKYHVFSRGIFEVNNKTVLSGQYYEEIPFYGAPRQCVQDPAGMPQISKFYEWKIIDCPRDKITGDSVEVKFIYFLEKGDMNGVYYVLGYSARGMHATVQLYQGQKPSFFQVERRMVQALLGEETAVASSHHSR